ncbi:hypothetical protein [Sabulibacter ruber]|uniref:hypothetical protein n=1 Tax=Sabulibacter ruber TaxID=2811901 RepID=UPI001A970CFC|nr:hypothetical protein [Sabulibacter ruber]
MFNYTQSQKLIGLLTNVSKVLFCLIAFVLICSESYGQYVRLNRTSVKHLQNIGEEVEQLGNPLKLGVSLGYNLGTRSLYNMSINPTNYTVQFERISPATVVLSTAVMFNVKTYFLREKVNPAGPATLANTRGQVFAIPARWSVGAVVNLAQFSAESNLYNEQIDGGLGIGYELNENIFVLGSFEFMSVKQPRDYFIDQYKGKNSQLIIDEVPVKNFNYDDDNIFINKYIPSVSLKIVFGLALTKPATNVDNASTKSLIKSSPKESEDDEK